jgi:excisionase family DNA binding protein
MPAYDTAPPKQSACALHSERILDRSSRGPAIASAKFHADVDAMSILDFLLDGLADRLAAAVIARLGAKHASEDEWLDSNQAAEYLGLHRDTLRRLAAARAIPAEQDGRGCKLFFRRDALDAWRRSGGRSRHLASVADAA